MDRRRRLRFLIGGFLVLLVLGLTWFFVLRPGPELIVVVEGNGIIDRFVQDMAPKLERIAGVRLQIKTYKGEGEMRPLLEADLILASASTLAEWKQREWIGTLPAEEGQDKGLEFKPVFAWGRPQFASLSTRKGPVAPIDILNQPKEDFKSRFIMSVDLSQETTALNLLINSKALTINDGIHWDGDKLLQTLVALSMALHENISAPVNCPGHCPLGELLAGQAQIAWLNDGGARAVKAHLEGVHRRTEWKAIQGLEALTGGVFMQAAIAAKPVLSSQAKSDAINKLLAALNDKSLRADFASYLLEPAPTLPNSDVVYWNPTDTQDRQRFAKEVTAILQSLVQGQSTPLSTRDRLLVLH